MTCSNFFLSLVVSESEILTDLSAVAVNLFQLQHAVLTFLHTFLNSITKNFGRKESRIVAFKDSVLQLNVILRIEWRKKRQWIQSFISLYIFGGNFNYTPSKYKHEFIQIFLFIKINWVIEVHCPKRIWPLLEHTVTRPGTKSHI